jgi:septal ring-binding cell division protein DamX
VNKSYGLALASLLLALIATPALADEAATTAPAANSSAYRDTAPQIDCRRAPGRALAILRAGANPCGRDGLAPAAPRSPASPAVAEAARPAQTSVTAAPPEALSATPRADRLECPTQVAGQPEKRPRHLLYLHLT